MKALLIFLLACCAILSGCKKEETSKQQNLLTNNSSGNPITAPVDYLGAVNEARKGALRTIDQAGLNNAIQLFYAQEERYPQSLSELAQKRYIQAVPQPPPGSRFVYDPQSGVLKIVRQ